MTGWGLTIGTMYLMTLWVIWSRPRSNLFHDHSSRPFRNSYIAANPTLVVNLSPQRKNPASHLQFLREKKKLIRGTIPFPSILFDSWHVVHWFARHFGPSFTSRRRQSWGFQTTWVTINFFLWEGFQLLMRRWWNPRIIVLQICFCSASRFVIHWIGSPN